jgi:hypothetical protein
VIITLHLLREHKACVPGLLWWRHAFGEAPVDYAAALGQLVFEGHVDWARWLLNAIGPTDTLHTYVGDMPESIAVPGSLILNEDVELTGCVLAGGAISAKRLTVGGPIAAGAYINAASIDCQSTVTAGGRIFVQEHLAAAAVHSNSYIIADAIAAAAVTPWAAGRITEPSGPR